MVERPVMDAIPSLNGTQAPELLPPDPETARIIAAYDEARSRDTALESRLASSHRREWLCLALLGMLVVALTVVFLARRQVPVMVQVVQVDEGRRVQLVGDPVPLLTYAPTDGQYMDMLGEFVRKIRWRPKERELREEGWRWAYYHACPDARTALRHLEETEPAADHGKRQVAVRLESITKTDIPHAYLVLWVETVTEGGLPPKDVPMTGTFTVGRSGLPTPDSVLYNRLALCTTGFNLSQR